MSFALKSNRAQPSVQATRKENYKILVSQMDTLDSEKIEHKYPRFGEDEVKSLCNTLCHNTTELLLCILILWQVKEEAFLTN